MNKSHLPLQKHKGSFSNPSHFQQLHWANKIILLPYGLNKEEKPGNLDRLWNEDLFFPYLSSVYFLNPVLLIDSGVNNCTAKWLNTITGVCWAAAALLETTAASSDWSHAKRRLCYGTATLCCYLYPPLQTRPVMRLQVIFSELYASVLLIFSKHKELLHSTYYFFN